MGDATDIRRGRGAVAGGLEARCGSRGELLGSRITRGGLLFLAWITAITTIASSGHGLRSAELASSWHLAAYCGIATTADVKGASGIGPLLLLASSLGRLLAALGWGRGGRVLVCLTIILLLEGGLALSVVLGRGHDVAVAKRSGGRPRSAWTGFEGLQGQEDWGGRRGKRRSEERGLLERIVASRSNGRVEGWKGGGKR